MIYFDFSTYVKFVQKFRVVIKFQTCKYVTAMYLIGTDDNSCRSAHPALEVSADKVQQPPVLVDLSPSLDEGKVQWWSKTQQT